MIMWIRTTKIQVSCLNSSVEEVIESKNSCGEESIFLFLFYVVLIIYSPLKWQF